jgi:hypothetical protein
VRHSLVCLSTRDVIHASSHACHHPLSVLRFHSIGSALVMNHEHQGTEYNRAAIGESNKEALHGRKWGNCNVKLPSTPIETCMAHGHGARRGTVIQSVTRLTLIRAQLCLLNSTTSWTRGLNWVTCRWHDSNCNLFWQGSGNLHKSLAARKPGQNYRTKR